MLRGGLEEIVYFIGCLGYHLGELRADPHLLLLLLFV